jgi:hypothetical protein
MAKIRRSAQSQITKAANLSELCYTHNEYLGITSPISIKPNKANRAQSCIIPLKKKYSYNVRLKMPEY